MQQGCVRSLYSRYTLADGVRALWRKGANVLSENPVCLKNILECLVNTEGKRVLKFRI